MTFADAADSPTGRLIVRLRYGLHRRDGGTVPVLTYRGATAIELTRSAWAGYAASGASISVSTDRERSVVAEALGIDPGDLTLAS